MQKESELLGSSRCLLKRDIQKVEKLFESTNVFFVGDRRQVDVVLSLSFIFAHFIHKLWISQKAIYEHPKVIYYQDENNLKIGDV